MKAIPPHLSQTPEEAYRKMKYAGTHVATRDPKRPEYHFHSAGQWMDDPNGSVYHNGYYHIMYGANPDSDSNRGGMPYKTASNKWSPDEPDWMDGIDVWGHARSRDLIHWEHLPISVFPDPKKDEFFIWWGCTRINGDGIPTIIYTSVGHERNPTDSAEQFIAYGDDELMRWKQADELNPILSDSIHGGKKYYEWRDPFMFEHEGRNFLILGGTDSLSKRGRALVLLYEALDSRFAEWVFRGELFEYPEPLRSIECPNIGRFGDKWAVIVSPHGPVEYFIGDIDFETYKFHWEHRGILNVSTNYYATNLVYDDQDRCILLGAIEGFEGAVGWNGAGALPRELSLSEDGRRLEQRVIPEVETLRREAEPRNASGAVAGSGVFELFVSLLPENSGRLALCYGDTDLVIEFRDGKLSVGGYELPCSNSLRVFMDKTVFELFADEREALSLVVPVCTGGCRIEVGGVFEQSLLWEYDTRDVFRYYDD